MVHQKPCLNANTTFTFRLVTTSHILLMMFYHIIQVWLLDGGFSTIMYTLILYAIMLLWRPSREAKSYGYDQLSMSADGVQPIDEFDSLELQDVSVGNG